MYANKFQVFIIIGKNSPTLPNVQYDRTEINNTFNSDILSFVWNIFNRVSNTYLASLEYTART